MTKFDWITIGMIAGLTLLMVRAMLKPHIDDPMRYHLRLKLGTDDFSIIGQAEDGSWLRLVGNAFCECEVGDFVYIEQLNGPTTTTRVKNIAHMNNNIYVHAVRVKS